MTGYGQRGRLNLSAWALRHRSLTLYIILAVAAAGIWAYMTLGRSEDPPFTIKEMVVLVDWPGASSDEMMREVTDRIERKLEELPSLDYTESIIQPGHAAVRVSLKDDTPPGEVPDLWYQVRKKIGDIQSNFPTGVQGPYFNDEFGDVFGIVYALTGDGFTLPQLRHIAEDVREQLISVPGVGKVELFGTQDECIYLDFYYHKLAELGVTTKNLFDVVQRENNVSDSGFIDTTHDRVFVRAGDGIDRVAALRALPIAVDGHLVPLGELARITRGTVDPPKAMVRFDGKPALGLGITMAPGGNIVDLGQRVGARMEKILPTLPLGVSAVRVNDQPRVVSTDIDEFQYSFLEALSIVLLVGFITLGWRTGLVIAISVPLVLAGTLVGMKLLGIDLQRISLGAMIIALGLLVDDAIIAVETMVVKLEQGWERMRAGSFAYTSTAFPMLTGTLITAAGYLPVGLADSSTGEYTRDIFRVVGLSLILSWFVAILFVPYLGVLLLPQPKAHAGAIDPESIVYDTPCYRTFRRFVAWCVSRRWMVIGATALTFAVALFGFLQVPQQFFPSSDRLEILIDMRLPEGASFAATAADVSQMEEILGKDQGVRSWVAYLGTGSPRFFLTSSPELDSADYAQFVINTKSVDARDKLLQKLNALVDTGMPRDFPDIRMRSSRLELGPPVGYPVQFRVLGPDPRELRTIAARVSQVMESNPHLRNVNYSWGNMSKVVQVTVDQNKALLLGLSSTDVSTALQTLLRGSTITDYREGNDLIPVIARAVASERQNIADLPQIDIQSSAGRAVPLSQIATIHYGLEEPTLWSRNRTPELVVQGEIADGMQAPDVTEQILPALAAIQANLPTGFRIETAGAVEESAKGQSSVNKIIPLMVLVMLSLLMLQLQSFSRMAMVILTAPLGLIGVAAALLLTGAPFGFVAMLGLIALAGIIMRNSIILVDQVDNDFRAGLPPVEAIVGATVRRARPIMLSAAAAVLALIPLAFSPFWGPMAISIMGGLISATLLTLFFVPALYAAWTGAPVIRAPRVSLASGPQPKPLRTSIAVSRADIRSADVLYDAATGVSKSG